MEADWQDSVQAFAADAKVAFGATLEGVFLFGSRARGDHRDDSDIDLAVVVSGLDFDFWRTKETVGDIAYRRMLLDGLYIQAMPISIAEWVTPRPRGFVASIKAEAEPVAAAA